ncbi:MAG: replication-relaxation family protein [Conexibacter sp.]
MTAPRRSLGAQPEYWEPVTPDIPALRSPARELVGNPAPRDPDEPIDLDPPRPASLLLLDRYDQIMSLGVIEEPRRRQRLARVRDEHVMVCKWLDRFGFMTTEQPHQAVLPRKRLRATQDLLYRMRNAGLIERRHVQISIEEGRRRGGSGPRLYSLLPHGYRLGQRSPGFYRPVIPRTAGRRRSEARTSMHLHHDLHTVGWWHAFEAALGPGVGVTDVFTPRYEEGRLSAPRIHTGRGYRTAERRDILLGGGADIAGIPNDRFAYTIEPDLTIRLELMGWLTGKTEDIAVDLLVEVDRTQRPARNLNKFKRYDQFLAGWALMHPRYEQLGTRPIVIFTSPDERSMLALMKAADEIMTGRIGWTGEPEHTWYYPGRDHVLFTTETEIHHSSMLAWRLPELPRELRETLGYEGFPLRVVEILPPELTAAEPPPPAQRCA